MDQQSCRPSPADYIDHLLFNQFRPLSNRHATKVNFASRELTRHVLGRSLGMIDMLVIGPDADRKQRKRAIAPMRSDGPDLNGIGEHVDSHLLEQGSRVVVGHVTVGAPANRSVAGYILDSVQSSADVRPLIEGRAIPRAPEGTKQSMQGPWPESVPCMTSNLHIAELSEFGDLPAMLDATAPGDKERDLDSVGGGDLRILNCQPGLRLTNVAMMQTAHRVLMDIASQADH